jgi:hypothetical protein
VAGVDRGPYKPFPFPVGTQFGDLTVVKWDRRLNESTGRSAGFHPWVRCACGYEFWTTRYKLIDGHTTRCIKCHDKSFRPKRYLSYAAAMPDEASRARLLNRLYSAINRCTNPNDRAYPNYGGRGIRVAAEWIEDKSKFLLHVAELPGFDDPYKQLDRIDNDRGYEPGNVRFVSPGVNVINRATVQQLRARIAELEGRLRHCKCGAEAQVHDSDE